MVAGDDDLRLGQSPEEARRLPELGGSRALSQVAGDHDQVGTHHRNAGKQRFEQAVVGASEMKVG